MWWEIAIAVLIPNAGGWLSALTMANQIRSPAGKSWYDSLKRPSWNPPNWVFAPAWTLLYSMMGFASYLVYRDLGGFTDKSAFPLVLYAVHLIVNWLWSPVFFRFHQIGAAFIHIIVLDILAAAVTVVFGKTNCTAGLLLVPYLGWLSFASYLNYTIWIMNKDKISSESKEDLS